MAVLLVIASMVALNTGLGDIAVTPTGERRPSSTGSSTATPSRWRACCCPRARSAIAWAAGVRCGRALAVFAVGSAAPVVCTTRPTSSWGRAAAGDGRGVRHARDAVALTAAYEDERTRAVAIRAGHRRGWAASGHVGSGVCCATGLARPSSGVARGNRGLSFSRWPSVGTSRDGAHPRLTALGAILVGGAVASAVSAILEAPGRGWSHPLVWGGLRRRCGDRRGVRRPRVAPGVARQPTTAGRPVVRLTPISPPGSPAIVILFGATFGFFYIGMQYVQQIMGYSALAHRDRVRAVPHGAPGHLSASVRSGMCPSWGCVLVVVRSALLLMAVGIFGCLSGSIFVNSTYLEFALAHPDSRYRHRNLHGANHFGDHGCRSRRKAGCRLRRERHLT